MDTSNLRNHERLLAVFEGNRLHFSIQTSLILSLSVTYDDRDRPSLVLVHSGVDGGLADTRVIGVDTGSP